MLRSLLEQYTTLSSNDKPEIQEEKNSDGNKPEDSEPINHLFLGTTQPIRPRSVVSLKRDELPLRYFGDSKNTMFVSIDAFLVSICKNSNRSIENQLQRVSNELMRFTSLVRENSTISMADMCGQFVDPFSQELWMHLLCSVGYQETYDQKGCCRFENRISEQEQASVMQDLVQYFERALKERLNNLFSRTSCADKDQGDNAAGKNVTSLRLDIDKEDESSVNPSSSMWTEEHNNLTDRLVRLDTGNAKEIHSQNNANDSFSRTTPTLANTSFYLASSAMMSSTTSHLNHTNFDSTSFSHHHAISFRDRDRRPLDIPSQLRPSAPFRSSSSSSNYATSPLAVHPAEIRVPSFELGATSSSPSYSSSYTTSVRLSNRSNKKMQIHWPDNELEVFFLPTPSSSSPRPSSSTSSSPAFAPSIRVRLLAHPLSRISSTYHVTLAAGMSIRVRVQVCMMSNPIMVTSSSSLLYECVLPFYVDRGMYGVNLRGGCLVSSSSSKSASSSSLSVFPPIHARVPKSVLDLEEEKLSVEKLPC